MAAACKARPADSANCIVADPRRTPTAEWATIHLPLRPGSDTALANGLLHVLVRDNLIDHDYIRDRTENFDEVRACGRCVLAGTCGTDHRRA